MVAPQNEVTQMPISRRMDKSTMGSLHTKEYSTAMRMNKLQYMHQYELNLTNVDKMGSDTKEYILYDSI